MSRLATFIYRLRKRLREVCVSMKFDVDLDTLYKSYYELN